MFRNGWLEELWDYRELFFFFIWRDVKIRYKQTVLGASWAVIQPLFTMLVFSLFFGGLAKMPSDGVPYPIFSYCALVPWTYFSGALALSGNCLVANSNLLTKVYFPRLAIPVASVLSGVVDFCIASILLIGLMIYYDVTPGWRLLLWPVLTIPLTVLVLGLGMILASLNVTYRDVKYAVPFGIQICLFVTPIIYPTSIIPARFRFLIDLNPLTGLIEAFRASVLPGRQIDWKQLMISVLISCIIFVVGLIYFKKTERMFADTI